MPTANADVRVVDPILTNVAQGYASSEFVGSALFPDVPVAVSGGQVVEFDRDAFRLYSSRRAPGGSTREILFGYSGKPFALQSHRLQGVVPREHRRDALASVGIDLDQVGVSATMRAMRLTLEVDQAALAFNPANYDDDHKSSVLANSAKWSSNGTPSADIDAGREAIRATCGMYPNVMLMGAAAYNACRNNTNVVERFKYNGQLSPNAVAINAQMLAGLFGIERVVVGGAVYWTDANVATDIWGNYVALAYVPQDASAMRSRYVPSYGYTYVMQGHPLAEPPVWDGDRAAWKYPVEFERVPVLSGIAAGYLIQTPA